MQARIIFPLLLLLSAAASWWFVSSLEIKTPDSPIAVDTNPDYFMQGVRTTVMNEAGGPRQELYAQYLAYFKNDNRTELTKPNLTVHRTDGSVWTVTADSGTVFDDKRTIYLKGSVLIKQPGRSKLVIEAQDMTIYPDKHTAKTDKPVKISSQESTVSANGMYADLKLQRLRLDRSVRGTYVP